jgi:hypothetical protein
MRKTVARLLALLIIPLGVILLYALAHEGGHALVALFFGGTITEFEVNFFRHSPHISYAGVGDPLHKALISLGGPVLPLVLVLPVTLILRRTSSALVQGASLLFLVSLLPTTLASAAVALAYGLGSVQHSEDIAKFLLYSGANPFVTATAFLLLFAAVLVFVIRVGRVKEAAAHVVKALRGSQNERTVMLVGRIVIAVLLFAVAVLVLRNVIGPSVPVDQPLNYHTRLDVNLEEIKPDSVFFYNFHVDEPEVFDFVYSVNAKSELTLRLVSFTEPFVFSGQNSITMFKGSSAPKGQFTGFTLLEGDYALEVSPGSAGTLTVYIDSREPSPVDLHYHQILTELNNGTFSAQTYVEEGYELVYEGEVGVGTDQLLASLAGGAERSISAFAVGQGPFTLWYTADGEKHILLEGFKATMGRWLPFHRSSGELRVSVLESPITFYIYVKGK